MHSVYPVWINWKNEKLDCERQNQVSHIIIHLRLDENLCLIFTVVKLSWIIIVMSQIWLISNLIKNYDRKKNIKYNAICVSKGEKHL